MEELISVIIPVFNMEAYLDRCIDSVLVNTYKNLEIICVDDGSTDKSLELLKRKAEMDKRIVVISKANGGVSSARNIGLEHAKGDFIAFIDSDDFIHPQYFELLMKVQKKKNADIVACDLLAVSKEDGSIIFSAYNSSKDIISKQYDCRSFYDSEMLKSYCTGRIFRGSIISGIRFSEDVSFAEDCLFMASVWEHQSPVCYYFPQKLYYYFIRSGSLVSIADGRDKLTITSICLKRAHLSKKNEEIYLRQGIKRAIFYRVVFISSNREISRCFRYLARRNLPLVFRSSVYSLQEKVRILAKTVVPDIYYKRKK